MNLTRYIVMLTFTHLGNISLTKSLVILTNGNCGLCRSADCIHYSAYEQRIPFITPEIVKAVYIQNTPFYIIDNICIISIKRINGIVNHAKRFANVNPFSRSFLRMLYRTHQRNFNLELNLNVFRMSRFHSS